MFPAGLSMLWESTDPHRALQERFGLDGVDDAARWLTEGLARVWAVDVRACDRIIISDTNAIAWVRTDRGPLVAKWSRAQSRFARLAATADLLRALHGQGLPVAPPLAAIDGRNRVIIESAPAPLSVTVQPLVEGELLDVTDDTAVRRAGACLAALHEALAGHRDSRLTPSERSPDLRSRIGTWLDREDAGVVPAASARLRELLEPLPPIDTPPQLVHNDYRASNILTAGSEIRAVIDFDEVGRAHRVHDLANAFVRLGTWFTDWRPTPPRVRDTLREGYESVRSLTALEQRWLRALALWYGIMAVPGGAEPAGWAAALQHEL